MAELYWSWKLYEVPSPFTVGDLKDGCVTGLLQLGYEDVVHSEDVHGRKPGVDLFAAMVFLEIADTAMFWQVVAVGGDADEADAKAELSQIEDMIAKVPYF